MRRPRLSSRFIGRLGITTLAIALAAVILGLGATAFAQGNASQNQYTNEPTQSEPSTAPATDTPGPDSTASASPDASQKSPSTATGTTPAQTSDTTAPTAPNTSQDCPWEPIPPGAYPGGPSGCPWWRGTPGGSSRVHPTRGELPEGQCYDTQLGVIYSCSGASQSKLSSGPTPPQPKLPPGPKFCVGGQSCDGVPNPGSKLDPRGSPKTIGDIVHNVRDAFLNLWIPAFVESSKGYVKARD
jgi:hypothetical protein